MHRSHILVIGDTYGHFSLINKIVEISEKKYGIRFDYVFHTGNSGLFNGSEIKRYINREVFFDRQVLMIHGNHDSKELFDNLINNKIRVERLKLFRPGGEILHIRICGVGVDMMGIGGSQHNSPGVDFPFDDEDYIRAIKLWEDKQRPDIKFLLTNECPTRVGPVGNQFFGDSEAVGSERLREAWTEIRPDLHFFGKYHVWNDYEEDGLKSVAIPSAHEGVCILEITRHGSKFTYEVHKADLKPFITFNTYF